MVPQTFDTSALAARHQLEAWRGWFSPVFDVDGAPPAASGFAACCQVWALGDLVVSRTFAPPLRAVRTRELIRRNPVDHWVLTIGQQGTTLLARQAELRAPAGIPFVLSLADELISERGQDVRLQFYFPRDSFREVAPLLDARRGRLLDSGMGRLLGDYLVLLERRLPQLSADELPRLTAAVCAMMAASLAPTADRLAMAAGPLEATRLEKVRLAVRRHLRSANLGPGTLCRQVGTSRSQLYRLLEHEGGVARYIQRQRLLASYAALSGNPGSQTVASIAEEFCFADASSFSRAFRQEFRMSPRDVRAAALAGMAPVPPARERRGPAPLGLSDCLRQA